MQVGKLAQGRSQELEMGDAKLLGEGSGGRLRPPLGPGQSPGRGPGGGGGKVSMQVKPNLFEHE